jgi:hypothetical protein
MYDGHDLAWRPGMEACVEVTRNEFTIDRRPNDAAFACAENGTPRAPRELQPQYFMNHRVATRSSGVCHLPQSSRAVRDLGRVCGGELQDDARVRAELIGALKAR